MAKAASFPSDAADKYVVRFPEGMRDRLKAAAVANNRTLNAEVIARLQGSFNERDGDAVATQARYAKLHATLAGGFAKAIRLIYPDLSDEKRRDPFIRTMYAMAVTTTGGGQDDVQSALEALGERGKGIEDLVHGLAQNPIYGEPEFDPGPPSVPVHDDVAKAAERENKVIIPQEPMRPRQVNRSPTRSPNARKPKP